MFKRSNQRKILEAQLALINVQIVSLHTKIIETLSSITNLLKNQQHHYARGYISGICDLSDLLKKQITAYITQSLLPVFESDAKLSYSLKEVEKKKDEVFEWLNEITQKTKQFQKTLSTTKDPKEIFDDFNKLLEKVCYDQRLSDFVNTLRVIVQEFEIYRASKPMDKLTFIFDNLKLHPTIKKASEKLFKGGHFAPTIFEAYKALNNYIKRKSKRKDLDGKDLMSKVFSFTYNRDTHQIERKPILQLNELRNQSDQDEQEGFMFLFMGAMQGIRNPKAHDIIEQRDPFKTLQYLSIASLLAKRVDEAKLNC